MPNDPSQLELVLESFETRFRSQPEVCPTTFAPDRQSEGYFELVTELVRVHMELAWGTIHQKELDDYLLLFPDLADDKESLDQIAFEEYRLRCAAGEAISPAEYQKKHLIRTWHWPALSLSRRGGESDQHSEDRNIVDVSMPPGDRLITETQPDLARRLVAGQLASTATVEYTLQRRLRFIGLVIFLSLLYLSFLSWNNPVDKVGLFLGSRWLVYLHVTCLLICGAICAALWRQKQIPLDVLRILEVVLFGSVLAELAVGLASDLFIDHELARPVSEGEHELFHYASSWSLPFFALIVAYGTLVPSSWRRCTIVVCIIGITPVIICTIAAQSMHGISFAFFKSFLMQMIMWMGIGAAIAVYGVRRLEETQYRLLKSGKLGKYRLIRLLATGGMGQVFLAEHAILNRRCAIKLMHPRWSTDQQLLRRFEREVQVLAAISHAHVVQVFDFGFTNDGAFYYVMEFLEGETLDELIQRNGPLPTPVVIEIMQQVTSALSVIHEGGIAHRDVKPSNIFLLRNSYDKSSVKLLDFGLIKTVTKDEVDETLTQDGAILGTPAFMSPEQAAGRRVDHRTDIYSLGAVAYFALSGKQLFSRSTAVETLAAHIHSHPEPVRQDSPSVPPELEEAILRCLAKDPAARFESADALGNALAELGDAPAEVSPAS